MKRQLDDYYTRFYNPLADRLAQLTANDCRMARDIAAWKERVAEVWDNISVVNKEVDMPESGVATGAPYTIHYTINECGLDDSIGLELVLLKVDTTGTPHYYGVRPFQLIQREGDNHTFECRIVPDNAGTYHSAVRMYPKNPLLPHRQDFAYVKWLE